MKPRRVFLISGSPDIDYNFLTMIKNKFMDFDEDEIYAIDKGLEICDRLQIPISKIIGDFDSIDCKILEKYDKIEKIRFSIDKDKSDTELAIDIALEKNFQEIIILNATGVRVDHFLFNILLLFKDPAKIKILNAHGTIWALKQDEITQIKLRQNTTFSLIPLNFCTGVSVTGSKYDLHDTNLNLSSLSLSNVAEGPVSVFVKTGMLLFFMDDLKL